MANRVLLGNRATGGYGAYVSKAGNDVLTCNRKELLMDSSQNRAGEVYAGGTLSTLSRSTGQNFLTTRSKSSLGYIPMVIHTEDKRGDLEDDTGDEGLTLERTDTLETTVNTIKPVTIGTEISYNTASLELNTVNQRRTDLQATNVKFMVLKIPLAYGYMTNTYFT